MTAVTPGRARELLCEIWMQQACMRPADRQRVLAALLKDGTATPGGSGFKRGSLEPRVAAASLALALAEALAAGLPATSLIDAVWRSFPLLTADSRARLTELLIEAAA
jgi:hypothetical protein